MQLFFNFSIALYLKELIVAELNSSNFFVTCYDESLNRVFQEEQMGMVLRYFNNKSCLVETSYFNSTFLKQPNSHNLHDKLLESLSTHDLRKLLQVSMDGPNVNWDVLKPHSSYREQTEWVLQVDQHLQLGFHLLTWYPGNRTDRNRLWNQQSFTCNVENIQ